MENMSDRVEFISYLKNISIALLTITLFIFPTFFLINTTDFFVLPKQLLIIFVTFVLLVLWGLRQIFEKRLTFISNPFNLPIFLLGVVILLSSLLSVNRYDSLLQSIPVISLLLLFFVAVNTYETKNSFMAGLSALSMGGVVACILVILYTFKVYVLPFPQIQTQYFNTFGSGVQFLLYIIPLFILSAFTIVKKKDLLKSISDTSLGLQALAAIVLGAGFVTLMYQIITLPQKPILLPYMYGFQIGLSSLSQDAARMVQAFLFGSGYGTFLTDFTRFRTALFNQEQSLWNVTFSYSSSFILELIATAGLLGFLTFLFLIYKIFKSRVKKVNPLFISLIVALGAGFILPLSFPTLFLFFMLLAFYTAYLHIENDRTIAEVVLSLVALKNGLFSFQESEETSRRRNESPLLAIVVMVVIVLAGGFVVYWTTRFLLSDMQFARSLQRDSLNQGQQAYNLENQAIQNFSYRSDYYRIFSQINFALSTSLMNNIPKNSSPSAQTQQTVLALLQQSINSGRAAATLAPATAVNWENLSQVYRNLINVGQNADQFSVASMNQAIQLDPVNPVYYVELGGIYYQLQRYDLAENAFRQAIVLKQDFSNAYYNLGHTLEQKGDLQGALQAYQVVREIVKNNADNLKKINEEIATLSKKIGEQGQQQQAKAPAASPDAANQPLQVNQPQTTIPPQPTQVKLAPPPNTTPIPSKGVTPTPKATQ